jgi:hypothetical protein
MKWAVLVLSDIISSSKRKSNTNVLKKFVPPSTPEEGGIRLFLIVLLALVLNPSFP